MHEGIKTTLAIGKQKLNEFYFFLCGGKTHASLLASFLCSKAYPRLEKIRVFRHSKTGDRCHQVLASLEHRSLQHLEGVFVH